MFSYSKGKNKFDNLPQQLQARSFKKFAQDVIKSVDTQKGGTYVCAAVACGFHKDTKKYPEEGHWRQQHLALPRRFLAFDFDGFEKQEVWEELLDVFPWRAFLYTTSSHTTEKPRARAFVELSRDVDHGEGVELGVAAQAYLETLVTTGWIKFDDSVYRSTQPIYTPVRGFLPYVINGEVLNVDYVIDRHRANKAMDIHPSRPRHTKLGASHKQFPQRVGTQHNSSHKTKPKSTALDDSPNNQALLAKLLRKVSSDCDRDKWRSIVWSVLSTGLSGAEELARNWSIQSDRYTETDFDNLIRDYDSSFEGQGGKISIGTLYHFAKISEKDAEQDGNYECE